MPELPEVETVRQGLSPVFEGAVLTKVATARPDLRFPFPDNFAARLTGARVETFGRRGKYLIAGLSTNESLIMHLGMSGRFTIDEGDVHKPGEFAQAQACDPRHDHVVFECAGPRPGRVTYNDPRRFGFMDLVDTAEVETCRHFLDMGPEPLGNGFAADAFCASLKTRAAPIKAALLDQCVVAGLGNIYVCEALYRARISPRRRARSVAGLRSERLHRAILEVLNDAIRAGGSSLKDFASANGGLGYFQHRFDVYDREGEACRQCGAQINRIVQSGRSTFFCPACQR
ncbi:MAG: bifunctional DNA-formamidopyrimidine glycosylase/DNA-(apurinic or apyrimidinic site) lyase [Pseudomonadota bacterium]